MYVWPVNDLETDLRLAVRALELVLQDEEYCDSEVVTAKVKEEQTALQERLDRIK